MSPAKMAFGSTLGEIAGTASFEITSIDRDTAGSVAITWNSRLGVVYGVSASRDLKGSWAEHTDSYESQGEQTSFTLPAGTAFRDPATGPRIKPTPVRRCGFFNVVIPVVANTFG